MSDRRMETSAPLPFGDFLKPWYEGLSDPQRAQERTLGELLEAYSKTTYGEGKGASEIEDVEEYQRRFPKMDYGALAHFLESVKKGDYRTFLSEPPEAWVMTRGTTGTPKVLPVTGTHLRQVLGFGARALLNLLKRNPGMTAGKMLNLSFPSRVTTIESEGSEVEYGYSSGTYSRLLPTLGDALLVPNQGEIDGLGPGIGRADWERRFELAYERALDQEIFGTIGVAPVILSFARHVKRIHGKTPGEIWDLEAVIATSVRKIHSRYAPLFRKYYGDVETVEIYSATEGVFGQQIDGLPYFAPNYDGYLFEVETGRGVRMLHELERGEWGRLIISTCMFPRYDIGDLIEAAGENRFRVFGRAKWTHVWEHRLYRALYGWFL